jgi:hypothetical protein
MGWAHTQEVVVIYLTAVYHLYPHKHLPCRSLCVLNHVQAPFPFSFSPKFSPTISKLLKRTSSRPDPATAVTPSQCILSLFKSDPRMHRSTSCLCSISLHVVTISPFGLQNPRQWFVVVNIGECNVLVRMKVWN